MDVYKKLFTIYSAISLFLIGIVNALNTTAYSKSDVTVEIINSTYTKDWLYYLIVSNKSNNWEFPLAGFSGSAMGPFTDAFGELGIANIIYLILWGLFIMMVWRQSGKVTIPSIAAVSTAGAWSLLFPESSQPWVLILLGAALASQLMTFFAKE